MPLMEGKVVIEKTGDGETTNFLQFLILSTENVATGIKVYKYARC